MRNSEGTSNSGSKKMSQLMFWNKQNHNNNNNNNSSGNSNGSNTNNNSNANNTNSTGSMNDGKNGKRNWLHSPDALVKGHVVYLVKFFGNLPVDQPKGIEVVKDAIRKLQFAQQMRKAETGIQEKFKKVEITVSVDGVAVQEPRTQKILHQFPLHNISYCADEKGVKKFFSFIAKSVKPIEAAGSTAKTEDTHECFVFISNKLASDITLTIGQSFDLAYRKYLINSERSDLGKAQMQIAELEKTISVYKQRLSELSIKLSKEDLEAILCKFNIKDILEISGSSDNGALANNDDSINLLCNDKFLVDSNISGHSNKFNNATANLPIVPPRNNLSNQILHKSSSQKMDELLLNSDSDSDFDPRAEESMENGNLSGENKNYNDLFGFEPSNSYGQQLFNNSMSNSNNINNNDHKIQNNNTNNSSSNNISFGSEQAITPPFLAPPPKVVAPRRSTSVPNPIMSNNNNNLSAHTNATDLFGSDPFDTNGPSIFKNKLSTLSADDFSLESLDPLRK